MRNISYPGHHGIASTCGYGTAVIDNTIVMIFEHKHIGTSPQNVIEELTTYYYNQDYPNVEPTNFRVFEADFSGTGLFTYQEVSFSVTSDKKDGIFANIKDWLGMNPPPRWYFSSPRWNPVSQNDQEWLGSLIAKNAI